MNEDLRKALETLQHRNDKLEAELQIYKDTISQPIITLQSIFNLTRQQAIILSNLATGRTYTGQWLAENCSLLEETSVKSIHTQIFRIREKIKPLEIVSYWGCGYRLSNESFKALKQLLGN